MRALAPGTLVLWWENQIVPHVEQIVWDKGGTYVGIRSIDAEPRHLTVQRTVLKALHPLQALAHQAEP